MRDRLHKIVLHFSVLFLPILFVSNHAVAQSKKHQGIGYQFLPAPDVWYNSVDGIRVGVRIKGQVPGTFNDGPHRLNLGVWFGLKRPKLPVSYFLSFSEPIKSLSNFGSEANIQLLSSVRTGFTFQGLAFNKRWQNGFNEDYYHKLRIYLHTEKLFNTRYQLFSSLWNQNWINQLTIGYKSINKNKLGKISYNLRLNTGFFSHSSLFEQFRGDAQQDFVIGAGFHLLSRFFLGLSSGNTPRQMLFMRGLASPENWLKKGITRARGTIPPAWLKEGWIQVEGGANLRGYTASDMNNLFAGNEPFDKNIGALNMEMVYPNPITNTLSKIEVVGDLLKFKSYLFFDSGSSLNFSNSPLFNKLYSDAGAGFSVSFSFPDNAGSMKKVTIRYDIPAWLSHVNSGPKLKYRNILALSAIISI